MEYHIQGRDKGLEEARESAWIPGHPQHLPLLHQELPCILNGACPEGMDEGGPEMQVSQPPFLILSLPYSGLGSRSHDLHFTEEEATFQRVQSTPKSCKCLSPDPPPRTVFWGCTPTQDMLCSGPHTEMAQGRTPYLQQGIACQEGAFNLGCRMLGSLAAPSQCLRGSVCPGGQYFLPRLGHKRPALVQTLLRAT